MRVIFFGTPAFAAEALKVLVEAAVEVVAAVTKPDKPQGRSLQSSSPPVKEVAESYSIPVYQPETLSDPAFAATLQELKPDLFVVVAYGEIIKQHVLDIPPLGSINLHASLLPAYRGAAPIQRAIIDGAHETGVSIMYLIRKMDAGAIIATDKIAIEPEMTFGALQEALCLLGAPLLAQIVKRMAIEGAVSAVVQDDSLATFAPKIELEECEIHWEKSAELLHNLIRGVNPYPGAWYKINYHGTEKRIKVWESRLYPYTEKTIKAGELLPVSHEFIVACGEGALELLQVQLEGKRKMSGKEFLQGFHA